ncbi:hypothetical protein [Mycobacterium aquaticum]|uniref:hypothetical protein n=1 Tax=Mycobacterium aquaticum TaxID=1927124 RepID=UPI001FE9BEA6|nr:hypothetical protein [Mycobacterium aquaticum]
MTIARGFVQHMAAIDARTEVPPAGLLAFRRQRHTPFIFSDNDIEAVLGEARGLRWRLPSTTHETSGYSLSPVCASARPSGSIVATLIGSKVF